MYKITLKISGTDARGNPNEIVSQLQVDPAKPERLVSIIGRAAVDSMDIILNGDRCRGDWLQAAKVG